MVPEIKELGVYALFAFLVIQAVLNFVWKLQERNDKRSGATLSAGDQGVDFWKREYRLAIREELQGVVVPLEGQQAAVLERQERVLTRLTEMVIKLDLALSEHRTRNENLHQGLANNERTLLVVTGILGNVERTVSAINGRE